MKTVSVKAKKLSPDAEVPRQADPGSSGFDVLAVEDAVLLPQEITVVPTGLAFEIPDGYEIQVRPRSGLAAKHGITVLNSPGTVDASYRGEVKVILFNTKPRGGGNLYQIKKGDRIAQLVVCQVPKVMFEVTDDLQETSRGEGGFGSTGV